MYHRVYSVCKLMLVSFFFLYSRLSRRYFHFCWQSANRDEKYFYFLLLLLVLGRRYRLTHMCGDIHILLNFVWFLAIRCLVGFCENLIQRTWFALALVMQRYPMHTNHKHLMMRSRIYYTSDLTRKTFMQADATIAANSVRTAAQCTVQRSERRSEAWRTNVHKSTQRASAWSRTLRPFGVDFPPAVAIRVK